MKKRELKFGSPVFVIASAFFVLVNLILGAANFAAAQQTTASPENTTAANLAAPPPATAAETPTPPTTAAEAEAAVRIAENLVHAGDVLDVDVVGSLEYDWRGKADDEGFLSALPFLTDAIPVLCRSESEIAESIAAAYQKILRDPKIMVRVIDRTARQPAAMFGAVRTQYRFLIQRPVRLNELLVKAGGISDRASGEIELFRPAQASCAAHNQNQTESLFLKIKLSDLLSGKPEANPFVRAGDIIRVEEAAPVYVTGGVAAPQRVLFRPGMSLSRAIASAGGVQRGADKTKITVFRRGGGAGLEVIEADYEKIIKNQAEDIELKPFDIVEVPMAGSSRNRRPPVVNPNDAIQPNAAALPLRVIN